MLQLELFPTLLVAKYLGEVSEQSKGGRGRVAVVMAQPDQDVTGAAVDAVHELDLLSPLGEVALVDANLVGP